MNKPGLEPGSLGPKLARITIELHSIDGNFDLDYFREPTAEHVAADSQDNSINSSGDSHKDINAMAKKPSGNISALNLKPNEVVLKKEVYRTEFAPYLSPG